MILTNRLVKALNILVVGLAATLFSIQSMAAPRVYEAGSRNTGSSNQAMGELFYQLQIMQEEMATLRGTVEELQNEVTRLKSQRLKDYKGLDGRIRALSGGTAGSLSQVSGSAANTETATTVNTTIASASNSAAQAGQAINTKAPLVKPDVKPPIVKIDEKTQYRTAYGLVRAKKFKEAKSALQAYLTDYPNGNYTPNGMYWLAELHLIDKEYPQAIKLFNSVASNYKSHRKTPDARFKLAKIHHEQGEKTKAKQMLTSIIAEYSPEQVSAAKLASNFLKKHYP